MNTVCELVIIGKQEVAFREVERRALQPHEVARPAFGAAKHGTEMAFFRYVMTAAATTPNIAHRGERRGTPSPRQYMRGRGDRGRLGGDACAWATGCLTTALPEHVWPESVRTLPAGTPWQAAVCLDPADFALGAVRDGHVRTGRRRLRSGRYRPMAGLGCWPGRIPSSLSTRSQPALCPWC